MITFVGAVFVKLLSNWCRRSILDLLKYEMECSVVHEEVLLVSLSVRPTVRSLA